MRELELPEQYDAILATLKQQVRGAHLRAHRSVNTELIGLYWRIGKTILEQQRQAGWGSKVVERLAHDLRREFPEMTGLSRSNLMYMRSFADAWPEGVPVHVHAMDRDPWFVDEGDLEAAEQLVASTPDAELFLYPGDRHLFADSSLPSYDESAAGLMLQRVTALLDRVG